VLRWFRGLRAGLLQFSACHAIDIVEAHTSNRAAIG
jgi:hypothetical protein